MTTDAAEFETWWLDHNGIDVGSTDEKALLGKQDNGRYRMVTSVYAWDAWQAALAAHPPVQPTELNAQLDQLRVSAINEDWETFDQVIREMRAPVQPTEPRESDPIAGISKRLDAALRSKG